MAVGTPEAAGSHLGTTPKGRAVVASDAMLELYQAEGCPHSQTVRETMTNLGLSYVAHNPRRPADLGGEVLNEQVHAEMVAISNEDQIPFLVDHSTGQLHADSDNIVEYLESEYGD